MFFKKFISLAIFSASGTDQKPWKTGVITIEVEDHPERGPARLESDEDEQAQAELDGGCRSPRATSGIGTPCDGDVAHGSRKPVIFEKAGGDEQQRQQDSSEQRRKVILSAHGSNT